MKGRRNYKVTTIYTKTNLVYPRSAALGVAEVRVWGRGLPPTAVLCQVVSWILPSPVWREMILRVTDRERQPLPLHVRGF